MRFWKQGADINCFYLRKRDASGWRNLMKWVFIILHTNWHSIYKVKKYAMGWNCRMGGEKGNLRGFALKIVKGPLGRPRHEWEKILNMSSMKRMGECGGN